MMNELADLRARLREEVGDEDYDLVLWATGQENRVIITDVLLTSPARAADLRSGDVIVRYGDEKIFSVSDLQHATRGGEVGDPVTVEVLRGDQELRTYLPRGPLGVRLQSARREPDTRR
jgi:S1-C subfamily serine protease